MDGRTHGRTDARTDNVKTVYSLQTKFAGGIIMVYVLRRSDCKISIFFQKFTKHSTFNSKDGYVLVFVKISYYHKNMQIYILLI